MTHHFNPNTMFCEGCLISAQGLLNDLPTSVSSEAWTGRPWDAPNLVPELLGWVDRGAVEIMIGPFQYVRYGVVSQLLVWRIAFIRCGIARRLAWIN